MLVVKAERDVSLWNRRCGWEWSIKMDIT